MSEINSTLTVEQKFAKLMLQLRMIRPFYSAIYEVMNKREYSGIDTVGVTTNELVYNYKFIDETPFEQLIFIMLHEIGHMALKHVARQENRNQILWNVAADLYVNQMLSIEFSLAPGGSTSVKAINIEMPNNGLFCSSIDLDLDYTEKIYEELEKQGKQNGFFDPDNHGDGNDNFSFRYEGSNKLDEDSSGYYSSYRYGMNKSFDRFKININRNSKEYLDLVDNGESQASKQQQSDKIVSDAVVRVEMSSNNAGDGAGGLFGYVKKMMKSELDWRKLLRKYLISATSTDSSFSRPDKRMYYQKQIYPGQIAVDENEVRGVKVCIDTSGSISDDDIAYFCGQVYQLTKQFKIQAELIYWDTSIESTGEFTGYKEFERVDLVGRGGTDPSVVFDYFDTKQCKVKPIVTLMFTDAWFSTDKITAKQRKKYKDTIWIMTRSHDTNFVPPFGKKAVAKFS